MAVVTTEKINLLIVFEGPNDLAIHKGRWCEDVYAGICNP